MSITDVPTVASDSFGIDLQGTFRTASFGGEALDNTITNQPVATPDVSGP